MKKLLILLTLLLACCVSVNAEPSTTGQTKTGTVDEVKANPPVEIEKVVAKRQNIKTVVKKTKSTKNETTKNLENTATEKKN